MLARVAAVAVAAAGAASAVTLKGAPPRVAIGDINGATEPGWGNYTVAMAILQQEGVVASFALLNDTQMVSQLNVSTFDVLIIPGGMSTTESAGLGPAGRAAVTSFVSAGGGYVGVCAGAYLAGSSECCDRVIDSYYCNGTTGCFDDDWALHMVDMGTANPWARGAGYVNMTLTDAAVDQLQLPDTYRDQNVTILYWQGPIQDKEYNGTKNYDVLATFTSEIHSGWTNYTTGQMVDTPAIITTTYGAGQGRVLLSSPHPEESEPMLLDLIRGYVLWASKAI